MILNIRHRISDYIQQYRIIFFFITISFLIGIIIGTISACFIPEGKTDELTGFVQSYCANKADNPTDRLSVFTHSFANNTRLLFVLWLSGLCYVFIPLTFCALGIKGFGIGFTVSFLVRNFGGKGFALALVSILPQGIFSLPVFAIAALNSVSFAWDRSYRESRRIKSFTYRFLVLCLFLVAAGLADIFIAPVFINSICNLF